MINKPLIAQLLTALEPMIKETNQLHTAYVTHGKMMSERTLAAKRFFGTIKTALECARDEDDLHMYFTAYLLLTEYILYHRCTIEDYARALRQPLKAFHESISGDASGQFATFYLKKAPITQKDWQSCLIDFHTTVSQKNFLPTPEQVPGIRCRDFS